ncbi:MAG: ChrR family anti-sigma-E factor [Pseudolabrys sp.]
MTRHHPKETTLAEFAAGMLDEGRSLVIAGHLAMCGECRNFVAALEDVGGVMLDRIEPVAMSQGATARALDRLTREPASLSQARDKLPTQPVVWKSGQDTLLGYSLDPWRWVSPGLRYRAVNLPAGNETRVFMLKAAPGLKLPSHRHTGTELTCVLAGAFIHEGGRYAAGDCDDADQDVGHSPLIDQGEECVCLVAMQGEIKLTSTLGRLIQPFVRL